MIFPKRFRIDILTFLPVVPICRRHRQEAAMRRQLTKRVDGAAADGLENYLHTLPPVGILKTLQK